MNDSILTSIKKMLGIVEEYDIFDQDLIMHINSVFSILMQLGIGPKCGFMIEDKTATWTSYMQNETTLMLVKSYMYLKVKIMFDPPLSSSVLECYKTQIAEYEWRLNVAAENTENGKDIEEYTGTYEVIPKAYTSQTLDTADKLLVKDVKVSEVPYFKVANSSGGLTSYIAKEADSK